MILTAEHMTICQHGQIYLDCELCKQTQVLKQTTDLVYKLQADNADLTQRIAASEARIQDYERQLAELRSQVAVRMGNYIFHSHAPEEARLTGFSLPLQKSLPCLHFVLDTLAVVMYIVSMEVTQMKTYSLWGNGGGDDFLIAENVSPLEAALQLAEDGSYQGKNGFSYFLVKPSRTQQCKNRGNVNPSDIASTKLPELSGSDQLWVCEQGGVYEHKHCDECDLLSVSQILFNRLDYAELIRVEKARGF